MTEKLIATVSAGLFALGLGACSRAARMDEAANHTQRDADADYRAIDEVYRVFSEAYDLADPKLVAALYTEDALYLAPGGDVLRGREAIEQSFEGGLARMSEDGVQLELSFSSLDRDIDGDLAYDIGYYTLIRAREGQEISRSKGKFVVVLKRIADGSWRIHADGYSDVPEEEEADPMAPSPTS